MSRFIARRSLYALALLFFTSVVLFLARPALEYLSFVANLLQGNLGTARSTGLPILTTIARGAPYTLVLGVTAFVLTYLTAVPLGILAAWKRNTLWDHASLSFAVIGMGVPNFFLAIVLIQVFGIWLRWLPVAGSDNASNLILPAVVLAFESIAINLRVVRSAILEEMGREYIRTLYAKGLSPARILGIHALRNALPVLFPLAARTTRRLGCSLCSWSWS